MSHERDPVRTLIDDYLEQQQRLQTPVTRAAAAKDAFLPAHDVARATPGAAPALAPVYRDLIPLTAPSPGEQYAFQVDLDACSGCKACVAGCHSLNGLDDEETWRDVGLLLGGTPAEPWQQTVTTACHHCADPACLNGCPVLAYEKDPVTGIVRHLDDQCIGCSYCILKCPYDVPKFSARLGIVRKCDMCHGRLAEGEAPACVQACPTHAITIVKVAVTRTTGEAPQADTATFLPGAPEPGYTQPTTRYVSRRPLPENIHAADAGALRPQPAHLALVGLLVLTQAGLGVFAAGVLGEGGGRGLTVEIVVGAGLFFAGLAASVAHLGQPLRAWRVVLGLRRSWLSREAVVLGLASGAMAMSLGAAWLAERPGELGAIAARWAGPAAATTVALGVLGVVCSAMIYVDTRRQFWAAPRSFGRMGGTLLVAAAIGVAPWFAALLLVAKLAVEAADLLAFTTSGRLLRGPLRRMVVVRGVFGLLAVGALLVPLPAVAFGLWLAGELVERALYFRAVDAPKMPGMAHVEGPAR